MRNVEKLGLVKYFSDLIEFNKAQIIGSYDHAYLHNLGWTEQEISGAKVGALANWFKGLIQVNKEQYNSTGIRYRRRFFLQLGWTEQEIDEAAKVAQGSTAAKILWFLVLASAVLVGLLYFTGNIKFN